VAQKSKPLPNDQKIVLKPVRLSTITLFVGIRYSIRDLLSDLNNYDYCLTRKIAICVRYGKWCQQFLWHQLTWASCELHSKNNLLDGDLCKNDFYFHTVSFLLVFKRDFIKRADFTRISASNTAINDVTN